MGISLGALGLIGAGVSAIGNLAGTFIGNNKNIKNQQKILEQENSYNRELAEYQIQAQRQNWQMENEYNTPANQIQRLRDAGLNPNLLYGNGSAATGNASSVSSPSLAHSANVGPVSQNYGDLGMSQAFDAYLKIMSLKNMEADANLKNSQAASYTEQLSNMRAQRDLMALELDSRKLGYQFDKDTYNHRLNQIIKNVENTAAGTENYRSQIEQRMYQNSEIQSRCKVNAAQALKIQKEIEKLSYDIVESISRTDYNRAKTSGQHIQNRFDDMSYSERLQTVQNIAAESFYRAETGQIRMNKEHFEQRLLEGFGIRPGSGFNGLVTSAVAELLYETKDWF